MAGLGKIKICVVHFCLFVCLQTTLSFCHAVVKQVGRPVSFQPCCRVDHPQRCVRLRIATVAYRCVSLAGRKSNIMKRKRKTIINKREVDTSGTECKKKQKKKMLMKSHKVRPGWTRNSSLRQLVFISFPSFYFYLFIFRLLSFHYRRNPPRRTLLDAYRYANTIQRWQAKSKEGKTKQKAMRLLGAFSVHCGT